MALDIEHLRSWIDRTDTLDDVATAAPLRALTATFDRDDPPTGATDPLPPCWHWLYFLPMPRQSEIGDDGHAKRGGFLPPVPLPRRMWAGSQLRFLAPIHVGQALSRRSRIVDVRLKEGRSGPLVFVNVDHEISADGVTAIQERHDIVYRELPAASEAAPAPVAAPAEADWQREIRPDDVLSQTTTARPAAPHSGATSPTDRAKLMETTTMTVTAKAVNTGVRACLRRRRFAA